MYPKLMILKYFFHQFNILYKIDPKKKDFATLTVYKANKLTFYFKMPEILFNSLC